ncbi:tetratricopeptide repeat protein [Termitidicoccus mucosus]|uniref:Uncharacterized protein n=1 Tax=Termitidicoccus mucosus TaxID=1184151 RepID=A0A178IFR4_9BACT|nr:hypothetical protein AW736_16490 [Opitutaceae bacterium TSB47]
MPFPRFARLFLALALPGMPAAISAPDDAPAAAGPPPAVTPEETTGLLRIAARQLANGDAESAEAAYKYILEKNHHDTGGAGIQEGLLALARAYRQHGDRVKAVAVYEKLLAEHPHFESAPDAYLELGRTLRSIGAYDRAIGKFYNVLHSTLKLSGEQTEQYRRLARTAQFEIAETHFASGDYNEAARLFSRLNLLDLAVADHERARFRAAISLLRSGNLEAAASSLESFIKTTPDTEASAEARYQLALVLERLGRDQESLNTFMDLLRNEHVRNTETSPAWKDWQRRTGNHLANYFYDKGDYRSALTVLNRLITLSSDARWQLPVSYQTALCHERLLQYDKAVEIYRQTAALLANDTESPAELQEIVRMAEWHIRHIQWLDETNGRIRSITEPQGSSGASS